MADPDEKVVLFEHWFPPHVLSSTLIRYGTCLSESGTVDPEQTPVFQKCDIHVYT